MRVHKKFLKASLDYDMLLIYVVRNDRSSNVMGILT